MVGGHGALLTNGIAVRGRRNAAQSALSLAAHQPPRVTQHTAVRGSARPQPGPPWRAAPHRRGSSTSSTAVSAPASAVTRMYVQCGWRRRSVGDPGFSRRMPEGATVSHGMWL